MEKVSNKNTLYDFFRHILNWKYLILWSLVMIYSLIPMTLIIYGIPVSENSSIALISGPKSQNEDSNWIYLGDSFADNRILDYTMYIGEFGEDDETLNALMNITIEQRFVVIDDNTLKIFETSDYHLMHGAKKCYDTAFALVDDKDYYYCVDIRTGEFFNSSVDTPGSILDLVFHNWRGNNRSDIRINLRDVSYIWSKPYVHSLIFDREDTLEINGMSVSVNRFNSSDDYVVTVGCG